MKSLFIPEIGTEITLAQDWIFNLHPETRNAKLLNQVGYVSWPTIYKIDKYVYYLLNAEQDKYLDDMYERHYAHIEEPKPGEYHKNDIVREEAFRAFGKERDEYLESIDVPNVLAFTFTKGTILKVDRIYIRKGSSDYSSLSFYVKNGEYKGKRFWAKLSCVNNIKFE